MNHSLLCVLLNHESRCLGGGGVCKGCECFGEQGGLGLGGGGGEQKQNDDGGGGEQKQNDDGGGGGGGNLGGTKCGGGGYINFDAIGGLL